MLITNYNMGKYPFGELVAGLLDVDDLAGIGPAADVYAREDDQSHPLYKRFYAGFGRIEDVYLRFVREVAGPMLASRGTAIIYQRVPTLRIHLPGNVAVGEFHCDADYGHQEKEVNFWSPLTMAKGTSTIWVESLPGKQDYYPVDMEPGWLLMFNGVRLRHGNVLNQTGSRVSFDFRAMSEKNYDPACKGESINTKMPFLIGGYYERMIL